MTANGDGLPFGGDDENVLKLTVVTVVQLCEYAENIESFNLNRQTVGYVNNIL